MPNHITNIVEFDCTNEEFLEIAEFLRAEEEPLGSVDFNKLIPMPSSLDVESRFNKDGMIGAYKKFLKYRGDDNDITLEKYANKHDIKYNDLLLGEQYYENEKRYGAADWYDWRIKNWGSKWNAYDTTPIYNDSKILRFCTAWNCVMPVIMELSRQFPDIIISYGWADENIGYNVGSCVIVDGNFLKSFTPVGGSKMAYELTASIMDWSLEDMGYVYSEETGTYEYEEELF